MKFFLVVSVLFAAVNCQEEEYAVTKEYTEYLKRTVSWETEEYENNQFRGWTIDEVKEILLPNLDGLTDDSFPQVKEVPLPASIDWAGSKCDHGPKTQGKCGSCWAFAFTAMLSDRCCKEWLAPQELVSCDGSSFGCNGGTLNDPINYLIRHKGLVPETCFPYQAHNAVCPRTCVNGKDFTQSHLCACGSPISCHGDNGIMSCLAGGSTVVGFSVCKSFLSYKSGVYKCDCTNYLGGHAVAAVGFGYSPECYYNIKNSWGTTWGDNGYFKIACNTCKIIGGTVCGYIH